MIYSRFFVNKIGRSTGLWIVIGLLGRLELDILVLGNIFNRYIYADLSFEIVQIWTFWKFPLFSASFSRLSLLLVMPRRFRFFFFVERPCEVAYAMDWPNAPDWYLDFTITIKLYSLTKIGAFNCPRHQHAWRRRSAICTSVRHSYIKYCRIETSFTFSHYSNFVVCLMP